MNLERILILFLEVLLVIVILWAIVQFVEAIA